MSNSLVRTSRRVLRSSLGGVLVAAIFLSSGASAQQALVSGDVLIANVDGLFHLRDGNARLLDTSTSLGLSLTVKPAVEWERGSDAVIIASDDRLLRVTVLDVFTAQLFVEDITPTLTTPGGGAPRFVDIDINPGNGDLHILEVKGSRVVTYAQPFAPGMVHVAELATTSGSRAMAYDSRRFPNGFAIGTSQQVDIYDLDGGVAGVSAGFNGLDIDHQIPLGVFQSDANGSRVQLSTFNSTMFAFDLNVIGGCQMLARRPTDVEWNSGNRYLYVLAEDGVNPFCISGFTGSNHVVRLPHVQGGALAPNVITSLGESGITGSKGDLTVVQQPSAFVVPYGTASGVTLDGIAGFKGPSVGNDDFLLKVEGGQPFAQGGLIMGPNRDEVPFVGGATLWVSLGDAYMLPPLGEDGELELFTSVPNDPTLVGVDLFIQSVHGSFGAWEASQGLQLHIN